jgi:ankyrin repeat protein
VENNDLASVQNLLKKGANINEVDYERTPLMTAAYYGNLIIAEYLIKQGADLDVQIDFNIKHYLKHDGFTALHFAAFYGHAEIAKLLINNGANLSITDKKGFTAYDYARQYNFNEIVKYIDTFKKQKEEIKNKRGKD